MQLTFTGFLKCVIFRILRPLSNPRARRIFVSHANAVTVKNALSFIKKITVIPMHAKDAPHCIQKLHYIHIIITAEFEDADVAYYSPFPVRCLGEMHRRGEVIDLSSIICTVADIGHKALCPMSRVCGNECVSPPHLSEIAVNIPEVSGLGHSSVVVTPGIGPYARCQRCGYMRIS